MQGAINWDVANCENRDVMNSTGGRETIQVAIRLKTMGDLPSGGSKC